MNAISLSNLSKTYPDGKRAVDSVTICLEQGEVFGFLGPNGAGKTTTVKLLNGMLSPTDGSCNVFGIDPYKSPEEAHALSGVVTEHAQMYDTLTGLENLVFYGTIFGLSPAEGKKRAKDLLEQLELSEAQDKKLATYSTGMRQRLSLARALIHKPKLLFLDEPTSGLDPESAQNVHLLIRRLAQEKGITVFLCTHQLRYAQEICTRYGLMSEGRLLATGTLEELRRSIGSDMRVKIRTSPLTSQYPVSETSMVESVMVESTISSEAEIPHLVRKIVEAGGNIYQVSTQVPSLEDIYFALTKNTDSEKQQTLRNGGLK